MNCLPVIEMEMRSACRRTWTFRLRLLFALAACATCLVVLMLPRLAPAEQGRIMLVLLSFLGLVFCLAAGGFLTADCVSAEKREGTLGLLFLTPLTGMDIVLGKLVCRGLQTFYGICAVFPVFFLPLLTGGVTWSEVCRVLLALGLALLHFGRHVRVGPGNGITENDDGWPGERCADSGGADALCDGSADVCARPEFVVRGGAVLTSLHADVRIRVQLPKFLIGC